MGYRSSVCIAIKNDVALPFDVDELLTDYFIKRSIADVDYYSTDDIKWRGVRFFEDFLNELDEDLYGFVRVGEDSGDVETSGNFYDFEIYPYTSIVTPFDKEDDDFFEV